MWKRKTVCVGVVVTLASIVQAILPQAYASKSEAVGYKHGKCQLMGPCQKDLGGVACGKFFGFTYNGYMTSCAYSLSQALIDMHTADVCTAPDQGPCRVMVPGEMDLNSNGCSGGKPGEKFEGFGMSYEGYFTNCYPSALSVYRVIKNHPSCGAAATVSASAD
jgi:hypothetical protein